MVLEAVDRKEVLLERVITMGRDLMIASNRDIASGRDINHGRNRTDCEIGKTLTLLTFGMT